MTICEHGQLARVCLTCELQAEVARLTADLAAMREACRWNHLCADEYRTGCGVNRHVPEDFCPDCGHPVEVGNESAPAAD